MQRTSAARPEIDTTYIAVRLPLITYKHKHSLLRNAPHTICSICKQDKSDIRTHKEHKHTLTHTRGDRKKLMKFHNIEKRRTISAVADEHEATQSVQKVWLPVRMEPNRFDDDNEIKIA